MIKRKTIKKPSLIMHPLNINEKSNSNSNNNSNKIINNNNINNNNRKDSGVSISKFYKELKDSKVINNKFSNDNILNK
jgi:hypothetical protein